MNESDRRLPMRRLVPLVVLAVLAALVVGGPRALARTGATRAALRTTYLGPVWVNAGEVMVLHGRVYYMKHLTLP